MPATKLARSTTFSPEKMLSFAGSTLITSAPKSDGITAAPGPEKGIDGLHATDFSKANGKL